MNALLYTTDECVQMLDEELHPILYEALEHWKAQGVLVFQNQDLSSIDVGHRFAIPWGSNNTLKEVPKYDVHCQVSTPRGHAWQYYLVAYSTDLSCHDEGEI